ncbi:MAG: hypothetical protein ABI051_13750 [Vicinamibacterales bacterium]
MLLVVALSLRPIDARPDAAVQVSGVFQNEIDLDRFVTRFLATTEEYQKAFRNLVAEETLTIEVYRASGELEKRRQIVSDLLVYHSSRDGSDATTECRDVRSVDGKAVAKHGERALKLFVNASKADSDDLTRSAGCSCARGWQESSVWWSTSSLARPFHELATLPSGQEAWGGGAQ